MSEAGNLWYVKTADGDVHGVTLDQLDEAFQAGRIDENVMVLAAGETKWARLGALAGLDAPPPASYAPNSLRPVSMDLGNGLDLDGLDENAFRKKSPRGLVIGAAVGIFAILGGILVMNRAHIGGDASTAAAAPPPVAVAAPAAPPPVVAASPAPPMPTTMAAPVATVDSAIQLSDDQRAKLAAADKALELKSKARKKNRAANSPSVHHSAKYKSQGFTSSGSKFDPLNANL
jgi:hypothetical protein